MDSPSIIKELQIPNPNGVRKKYFLFCFMEETLFLLFSQNVKNLHVSTDEEKGLLLPTADVL